MTKTSSGALIVLVALLLAAPALAQDAPPADPALDALLKAEKEARKACKIEICSLLHTTKAEGADVACHVVKTWPKDDVSELIKSTKMSWPWGHAKCEVDVKAKRAVLVAARNEEKYEVELDEHTVACSVDRGAEAEPLVFKIALKPKITFAAGKATKAVLNWGTLEAPSLAKGVLWPATALDNQMNVLESKVVDAVNEFVDTKCLEVKDAWKDE